MKIYATFSAAKGCNITGHYALDLHPSLFVNGQPSGDIANAILLTESQWQLSLKGSLRIDPDTRDVFELVETEDELLDLERLKQIDQINLACEASIIAGFESSALGHYHRYQSDRDDQTNLLGLVAAGTDLPLKCLAMNDTAWSYLAHTAAQLKLVLRDGANHKLQLLQRCNDIKLSIKNAQTLDAIQAEVWAEE